MVFGFVVVGIMWHNDDFLGQMGRLFKLTDSMDMDCWLVQLWLEAGSSPFMVCC